MVYFSGLYDKILKFESSPFAFVCFKISTLLKLENSCLLLFSEGLKFQALEGLKFQDKQTQKQMIQTFICTELQRSLNMNKYVPTLIRITKDLSFYAGSTLQFLGFGFHSGW